MLKFFYQPSPYSDVVALFLEESGLPYTFVPVQTRRDEQFSDEYAVINPNEEAPAILDGAVRVLDSNEILLYLSEKSGKFMPASTPTARAELLSWMLIIGNGIGSAPKGLGYAANRYLNEARRRYAILNARLSEETFVLGSSYTIADMSAWGWVRALPYFLGEHVSSAFPHIKRWFDRIDERPAVHRLNALKERYEYQVG